MATTGATILTKTASDGRAIEVVEFGDFCRVRLAGELLTGYGLPLRLAAPKSGATHYLPTKPAIGLTAAEAAAIEAHFAAKRQAAAAAFAASPEGRLAALRREREGLVGAVAEARDRAEATFARLHAAEDATAWSAKAALERAADEAAAALADFDAAHPEVLAAVRAARDAEYARSFVARGLD